MKSENEIKSELDKVIIEIHELEELLDGDIPIKEISDFESEKEVVQLLLSLKFKFQILNWVLRS